MIHIEEETTIKVLFIGDIVGSTGRDAVKTVLPYVKDKYKPHIIIANGENAAGGKGITAAIAHQFFEWGIHGITLGNHTWDNKDIFEFIDDEKRMVRPANFPEGTPGQGHTTIRVNQKELVILNLQGRTFMNPLDCPFKKADEILQSNTVNDKPVLVDFHAEATSEKIAMGWYLDGRVSCAVGTHTHVQTNDHIILPGGTAYVTDVGMVGPQDSVLGMEKEAVIRRFLTQLPVRFNAASGAWVFHAVCIDINDKTNKADKIELIRLDENKLIFM